MLVAGVDSSTQSTKIVLCRAEDGRVVGRGSAPHPGGTECDPRAWWAALQQAGRGLLQRAAAIGVAGQQHGMIVLDDAGEVIRPALLWNDLRSAAAAGDLVRERGGPQWWADNTGSVPAASFTVTKLRWLAEHEPASAARTAGVLLPHDWLTWRLRIDGRGASGGDAGPRRASPGWPGSDHGGPITDRGDASGTGYFSPRTGCWLPGIAAAAIGHPLRLPRIGGPAGSGRGSAPGAGGPGGRRRGRG